MIGRLGVLGSSSLATHPDRGSGGLVLAQSAVAHLHTLGPGEKNTRRDELSMHDIFFFLHFFWADFLYFNNSGEEIFPET